MIFSSIFIKMAKIDDNVNVQDNNNEFWRSQEIGPKVDSILDYPTVTSEYLNLEMKECLSNSKNQEFINILKLKVEELWPQYPQLWPLQAFINNDNNEQVALNDNRDSVSKNGVV